MINDRYSLLNENSKINKDKKTSHEGMVSTIFSFVVNPASSNIDLLTRSELSTVSSFVPIIRE